MDSLAAARLHPFDQALIHAFAALPLLALGFTQRACGSGRSDGSSSLRSSITGTTGEIANVNFAGTLPIVDAIFGTAHLPAEAWPQSYGADAPRRAAGGTNWCVGSATDAGDANRARQPRFARPGGYRRWIRLNIVVTAGAPVASLRHTVSITMNVMVEPRESFS